MSNVPGKWVAAAAVTVALVTAIAVMAWRARQEPAPPDATGGPAPATADAPPADPFAPNPSLPPAPTRRPDAASRPRPSDSDEDAEPDDEGAGEPSEATAPAPRAASREVIANVLLTPGRGHGGSQVTLPEGASGVVQVRLDLPRGQDEGFRGYNAELLSASGGPIMAHGWGAAKGVPDFVMNVDARRLAPGEYSVRLHGFSVSGQREPIATYSFRVAGEAKPDEPRAEEAEREEKSAEKTQPEKKAADKKPERASAPAKPTAKAAAKPAAKPAAKKEPAKKEPAKKPARRRG